MNGMNNASDCREDNSLIGENGTQWIPFHPSLRKCRQAEAVEDTEVEQQEQ